MNTDNIELFSSPTQIQILNSLCETSESSIFSLTRPEAKALAFHVPKSSFDIAIELTVDLT